MLHSPNLLSSPSSVFCRPPITTMLNFWQWWQLESPPSTVEVGILQEYEEAIAIVEKQLVGKKRRRWTKEGAKNINKTNKKNVIEVDKFDEKNMTRQ